MTDHTLQKQMIQTGGALAGLSVAFGAFGAHVLKDLIDEQSMNTFQTALRYQFYHAFTILLIGSMMRRMDPKIARIIFQLFLYGIGIFCGTLYILSLSTYLLGELAEEVLFIGALTPVGGVLLVGGWALLVWKGYKYTQDAESSTPRHRRKSSSEKKTENII